MSSPRFSVIIPTHNRSRLLAEAVESVLSQTVGDLECIVVDDASPSAPELPPDPRVRLVRRPVNGGPAATRNNGLDVANGMFIAFLDDDDVWIPERLEVVTDLLERAPVAICWSRYMDGPPNPWRVLQGDVHDTILDSMTPNLGATVVQRGVAPRFDESFHACEDVEWWLRLGALAEVETVPTHAHLIRRHDTPRLHTGPDERIAGNRLLLALHADYFRTHRAAEAFRWFRLGLTAANSGDRRTARNAIACAFRRHPSARYAAHLLRVSVGPIRRS